MLSFLSSILTTYLLTLGSMAFFTLLERKILGYSQTRKGPNKTSLMGLPQPMADALKLFTKQSYSPQSSNLTAFYVAPLSNLMLALMMWIIAPSAFPSKFSSFSIMIFLCISSIAVYTTLVAGWTSNSKYSLLGALRSVAQTISYEVSMALTLINILVFISTLNLQSTLNNNQFTFSLLNPIIAFIWSTTMLAETNRAPFDFAEGESELVSGFNTEYASGLFAMIFMSEYLNIMFMSLLTATISTYNYPNLFISFYLIILKTTLLSASFVIVRTTYPRMRYDRLMNLTWTSFLPLSLMFIILSMASS